MIGSAALIAGLLAFADDRPPVDPALFRAWFDASVAGTLAIPPEVERGAKGFRYVFVGGFANEQIPGYFTQNSRELRDRGVPPKQIHVIQPSSRETIDESAGTIRDRVRSIAAEGPQRLVIVAHSRGACDALAFALTDPDFVRDRVEALFLVQGAFGGTALADFVVGDAPAMDDRMAIRHRVVAGAIARIERGLVRRGHHAGIACLTRGESRPYWDRMLQEHADAIPVLRPRTYFIRSTTEPARLGRFRRAVGVYLTTYEGPNDGVVCLRDQVVPGVGTTLCDLECGHGDLTCKTGADREPRRLRQALVRSILMAVGKPRAGEGDGAVRASATPE